MGRKICSINSKLTYRNLRRDQRIKERIEEYDFQNAILKISSILEDYLPKRDINNVFVYLFSTLLHKKRFQAACSVDVLYLKLLNLSF